MKSKKQKTGDLRVTQKKLSKKYHDLLIEVVDHVLINNDRLISLIDRQLTLFQDHFERERGLENSNEDIDELLDALEEEFDEELCAEDIAAETLFKSKDHKDDKLH
jgi:hypothetical protein